MYSSGSLHLDEQRQDVQQEPTYNSCVTIQDLALKTGRKQWSIEKDGEKRSGISMLMVQHDGATAAEDIYIYSCRCARMYLFVVYLPEKQNHFSPYNFLSESKGWFMLNFSCNYPRKNRIWFGVSISLGKILFPSSNINPV